MIQLPTKLVPMEQWFCDGCGDVIKSLSEGVLEWESVIAEDEHTISAKNFRILHDIGIVKCRPEINRASLSDWPLSWAAGPNGLVDLLALFDRQKVNYKELNEIVKRMHVKLYEEARTYLPLAQEDGETNIDPYGIGELYQKDMEWLIRKYSDR